jgi:Ran GTPase-activating protein (RanGAP) involved in mRNA processing and transport
MIDDQMLLSSKQNLLECTHISKLNLSLNAFGVLGLSVINELAEKEGCLLS